MAGPVRILLAAGEADQARLGAILAGPGRELRGVALLAAAREAAADWAPHLVILDRRLPDGDGLELCRDLRAGPRFPWARVLVLTGARPELPEKVAVFEAGADGYLAMPVAPEELAARVDAMLRFRQAEDADREQALAALRDSTRAVRKLERALEHSPATVVITDLEGNIEYVNPSFQALTGYAQSEAMGQNTRILRSGFHSRAFYRELWDTVLAGRVWRGKFRNRKKDGQLVWERASIAPVLDDQGRIESLVAVKEDVTDLIRTEEELKAARTAAETASLAKSTFLANMSHEIRTPLNAVVGFIHLLQATGLTPKQQEFLDKAAAAAGHLHEIISEILDFSKIEAGRFELEVVPFDPRETLANLAGALSPRIAEKGLRLVLDQDPRLPPLLLGDPLRLGQLLLNFASNAVKFTEAGTVTVAARVLQRDPARARLRFEVRDTGIGMTEAQLGNLFQPFSQADGSSTRRYGGTGLGLAIAHRMAQLMGGEIAVSSRFGEGSCFSLELALPLAEAPEGRGRRARSTLAARPGAPPLEGLAVLLAEDNPLNRLVAKEILVRAGAVVTLAGEGQEALDRLREGPCDVVLMDLQMPGMNGLEAARAIRAEPAWADLPIIALTAEDEGDVREQVAAAGMDDYLTKPIEPAGLVRTLARHVARVSFEPSGPGQEGLDLTGRVPGVDTQGALARLGLDRDTYLQFLARLAADEATTLAGLETALAEGDLPGARRQAHSLLGAALNLGANALATAARDLEGRLQAQAPDALGPALARTRERLRELAEGLALLNARPAPAAPAARPALDWPALAETLEALRRSLREDDAKASQDWSRLEGLLQGSPLHQALAPLRVPVGTYEYGRALELFPALLAEVEAGRTAE